MRKSKINAKIGKLIDILRALSIIIAPAGIVWIISIIINI